MFDTLYLGSEEAFSKADATAWVQFDLADAVFQSLSGLSTGAFGYVLAAIDARGTLHLLEEVGLGHARAAARADQAERRRHAAPGHRAGAVGVGEHAQRGRGDARPGSCVDRDMARFLG